MIDPLLSNKAQSYTGELVRLRKIIIERHDSSKKQSISERGLILRLENGRIQIHVEDLEGSLPTQSREEKGRILDDSSYSTLIATGELGDQWIAQKVLLLSEIQNFHGKRTHIFELCSECFCKETSVKKTSVKNGDNQNSSARCAISLLINEKLDFPSPWKYAIKSNCLVTYKFESGDSILLSKSSISKKEDCLLIQYLSDEDIEKPIVLARTICESMRFVLAQRVSWFYMEKVTKSYADIWLSSSFRRTSHNVGRAKPPIQLGRVIYDHELQLSSIHTDRVVCSASQFWQLYDKYFSFVIENRGSLHLHYLSGWLDRMIEIEYQSLEAEMLTVSVAVESIVKKYADTLNEESIAEPKGNEGFKDSVRELELWVKERIKYEGESSFIKRLNGFLSTLRGNKKTDKDKLRDLCESKLVDGRDAFEAWNKLRNSSAHGNIVEPTKIASYVEKCDQVNLLLFHLIFLIIGYEGPFSDYSQKGWPTKAFGKGR